MKLEDLLGKSNPPIASIDRQSITKEHIPWDKIPNESVHDALPKALFDDSKDEHKYPDCQFYKYLSRTRAPGVVEYMAVGDVHTRDEQYSVLLSCTVINGVVGPITETKINPKDLDTISAN